MGRPGRPAGRGEGRPPGRPPRRPNPVERGPGQAEPRRQAPRPGRPTSRGSSIRTTRPRNAGRASEDAGARDDPEGRAPGDRRPLDAAPSEGAIWGRRAVLEALRAGAGVERLYVLDTIESSDSLEEILRRARSASATVTRLGRQALDRLAGGGHHQGIVAEVAAYDYARLEDLLEVAADRGEAPMLLLLDSLQDTHNLGSLIRTAEAVGAHGVVIPKHRAVGVTGAVVKASAGAIEHLRVAQVNGIAAAMSELKDRGLWIVGLSADAGVQYDQHDYTTPTAIVVGAEGAGLSRLVSERCDVLVRSRAGARCHR